MDDLLVDMGNTAVKWCLGPAQGRRLGPVQSMDWPQTVTGRREFTYSMARTIAQNIGQQSSFKASRQKVRALSLLYCSVTSAERTEALVAALSDILGCQPRRLLSQARLILDSGNLGQSGEIWELHNSYKAPRQLGSDRWAALVGLMTSPSYWKGLTGLGRQSRGPIVLVSAGTATVMDWLILRHPSTPLRHRFDFQGGTIRPGYGLMAGALGQSAAGLGPASPVVTRRAMQQGIGQAQVSGVFSRGMPSLVVVHGGFAKRWCKDFYANEEVYDKQGVGKKTNKPMVLHTPGLILQGLRAWGQMQP
jgi:pantothenate kinase type III